MNTSKKDFLQSIETNQGIIKSLCGIYYPDVEDQKDVWQDIILQLWRSFNSFRGDSEISTWIYKVSLNTILSKRKKEQKQPFKESINSYHEKTITSSYNSDDDLQFLKSLMLYLNDLDKAIVVLFLEGYKNKEIGKILGLSSSNIGTRMNRIKMKLKSKINI